MKKLLVLLAVAAVIAFASSASAADATNNLTVDATVATECTVTSGAIHFGSYAPITATSDAASSGNFTVFCTKGSAVHIGMGQGANYNSVRRMKHGTEDFLGYALFSDVDHEFSWGDASDNSDRVAIASTAGTSGNEKTVFGLMTKNQNQPAGDYTDEVAINVWLDE
jgi:spore coat protein U-like protein